MNDKARAGKGKQGELAFQNWLDSIGIGYLYIGQSKKKFPSLFKGVVKRPDFFVLLDGIGMIAIDVKHKELSGGVFTLDSVDEVEKTLAFERNFRIAVWYVYYRECNQTWYWISALKAQKAGKTRTNGESNKEFFAINISEFLNISNNDDLGKLYTQRGSQLS